MIWCKNCPRCNGDLVSQSDIYGKFVSCLQCGCILNEQEGLTVGLDGEAGRLPRESPQRQLVAPAQTRREI
jgi:hypothetical protein